MKIHVYFRHRFALVAIAFGLVGLLSASFALAAPLLDIQAWIGQKDLPLELASPAVVESGGYVYVIGGKDKHDDPVDSVESLLLSNNGNSDWRFLAALPAPLYLHAAIVATPVLGGPTYIYVIGGWDGTHWQSKIWRTQVASNGDIKGWDIVSNNYPEKVVLHDAIVVNNRIYVLGGENEGHRILKKVYYADIDPQGDLSTWKRTAYDLPVSLYRHSAVVYQGSDHSNYIYVIGGYDGKHAQKTVYYAKVNEQNDLATDWTATTELPIPSYYHKSLIYQNAGKAQLYVLGGKDDDTEFSTIYAAIFDDISNRLVGWERKYGLAESLYRFGAISLADQLYVFGGLHNDAYRAQVYLYSPPMVQSLNLTSSQTANQPDANGIVTYTLHLTNGPDPLTNVMISNTIPAGVTLIPDSFSIDPDVMLIHVGTNSGDYLNWQVNVLAAGAQKTIMYRVQRTTSPNENFPVFNGGAMVTWDYQSAPGQSRSNAVSDLANYLPLVMK